MTSPTATISKQILVETIKPELIELKTIVVESHITLCKTEIKIFTKTAAKIT